jgi:hypothetical protein
MVDHITFAAYDPAFLTILLVFQQHWHASFVPLACRAQTSRSRRHKKKKRRHRKEEAADAAPAAKDGQARLKPQA